jgi:hypothetical protein
MVGKYSRILKKMPDGATHVNLGMCIGAHGVFNKPRLSYFFRKCSGKDEWFCFRVRKIVSTEKARYQDDGVLLSREGLKILSELFD